MKGHHLGHDVVKVPLRPMHIVLSHPDGSPITGKALCGKPVESFQNEPMRTDRVCQGCVLADLGLRL